MMDNMNFRELTRKEILASRRGNLHLADKRSQERMRNWVGGGWMPLICGPIGQVSGLVPLVSPYVKDLVSGYPPITFPRYFGVLPSRRVGETGLPKGRYIRTYPVEISVFSFLLRTTILAPVQPVLGFYGIADDIREMAEEESTEEAHLNSKLLELKMRYEMGEISEEEYKKKEAEITKRIEELKK
ncbi:gas vesicle protein GvpG [Candidatus Aerophobetes bacterium]|nr:gas vesicle protein GvpG [Candidatus Aerophobetes bacterium]